MKLNKNIFQIYIQDDPSASIPAAVFDCMRTISDKKSDYDYYILNNNDLEDVIKKNLGDKYYSYFKRLNPYSYRADFGRYALLYLFGGWYLDSSVKLNLNLKEIANNRLVVFRDAPNPGAPSWDASNSVIYAHAKQELFLKALDKIIKNIDNDYYGTSAHCPTGPTLFGKCLALEEEHPDIVYGMLQPLTPNHNTKNYAFVLPDGKILAWGKSTWGTVMTDSLDGFGAAGTNSYMKLYYSKNIYTK